MTVASPVVWDATAEMAARRGDGSVVVQSTFNRTNGCPALSQRLLRLPARAWQREPASADDDVMFVVAGRGKLWIGKDEHALAPETAAYVRAGEAFSIESGDAEPLVVASVRIRPWLEGAAPTRRVTLHLADAESRTATASREFRLLMDPDCGPLDVTQFVGEIPSGRAPDHYHHYDEVLYVLEGDGILHDEDGDTPVSRGACIHLRPNAVHSLENAGTEPLRVLGVFRPAGSPAEAYYPDGTLASESGS